MINSFPSIMKGVLQKHGILTPCLDRYILEREAILQEIMTELPFFIRDDVKKFFLISLHMGDYRRHSMGQKIPFLDAFWQELFESCEKVFVHYPAVMAIVKNRKKKNWRSSAIALICQQHESIIMKASGEFMQNHGFTLSTSMFDGEITSEGDMDFDAHSDFVFLQTGLCVRFLVKPFVLKPIPASPFPNKLDDSTSKVLLFHVEGCIGRVNVVQKKLTFFPRPGAERIVQIKNMGYKVGIFTNTSLRRLPVEGIQKTLGLLFDIVLTGEYCYAPTTDYATGEKLPKDEKVKDLSRVGCSLTNIFLRSAARGSIGARLCQRNQHVEG